MKEIQLTQGKVALVDDRDFEALSQHKWYAHRDGRTFYATRKVPKRDGGRPRQKHVDMHQVVLSWKLGRPISPGMQCDHEDGNGLNNVRDNLREVTHRGNSENQHVTKTSKYMGVCWYRAIGKWRAYIRVNGNQLHLGVHATEIEAARAREAHIVAHPELMARLNFPRAAT